MAIDCNKQQPWDLELRAAAGPTEASFRLRRPHAVTIGRRSANDFQLNDPAVSRDHALMTFRPVHMDDDPDAGKWLIDDLGSTHGTWLNGVRLKPGRQYHLRSGDLLVLGPWTFRVVDRKETGKPATTLATVCDMASVGTVVARLEEPGEERTAHAGTQLLLRCSERIHAARTEEEIAEAVVEGAIGGTDFGAAAFLRPLAERDRAEVVAFRRTGVGQEQMPSLSVALIREAASGSPACLQRGLGDGTATSSAEFQGVVTALCVPVMVEATLAGFIYLDAPKHGPGRSEPGGDVGTFPVGLARLAAMGMANLMRIDIALRQERMEAELQAAKDAQRWLLPHRQGRCGPFTYAGETRQGRQVGGDFFDIVSVDDTRLGVVFGDVGGRGMPVSVLVSASQGFLHACLMERVSPSLAAAGMDRLYSSRISHSRFLKLWIGVLDAREQTLSYVDAGHGAVMTVLPDGRCDLLPAGMNPPIGTKDDVRYREESVGFPPGSKLLILSDGFVEQRAGPVPDGRDNEPTPDPAGDRPRAFGISRVQETLQQLPTGDDEIAALFAALDEHAGTPFFDDDATAVTIRT